MWKVRESLAAKKNKIASVQLSEEVTQDPLGKKIDDDLNQNDDRLCINDEDCPDDSQCESGVCEYRHKSHLPTILTGILILIMVASFIIAITASVRHSWKLSNGKCRSNSTNKGVDGSQRLRIINDLTICTWLFLGVPVVNLGLSSALMHNVNRCGTSGG